MAGVSAMFNVVRDSVESMLGRIQAVLNTPSGSTASAEPEPEEEVADPVSSRRNAVLIA